MYLFVCVHVCVCVALSAWARISLSLSLSQVWHQYEEGCLYRGINHKSDYNTSRVPIQLNTLVCACTYAKLRQRPVLVSSSLKSSVESWCEYVEDWHQTVVMECDAMDRSMAIRRDG